MEFTPRAMGRLLTAFSLVLAACGSSDFTGASDKLAADKTSKPSSGDARGAQDSSGDAGDGGDAGGPGSHGSAKSGGGGGGGPSDGAGDAALGTDDGVGGALGAGGDKGGANGMGDGAGGGAAGATGANGDKAGGVAVDDGAANDMTIVTDDGAVQARPCSQTYNVPATANPYMAGVANGTTIAYPYRDPNSVDTAPAESPKLVVPLYADCLKAGAKLYFQVSGTIDHGGGAISGPDGRFAEAIPTHMKGALLGKSDVKAPINSLLAVFLGDGDPSAMPPPAMLDFSSAAVRNYGSLSPQLNQIFFIGDGKNDAGKLQRVIVPAGAKRFYLAIMDSFEWNNNTGGLSAGILWQRN